jgi:hypothetical protein
LRALDVEWDDAIGDAFTSANLDDSGQINLVFALPATAVPSGTQALARVQFLARSVPADTEVALRLHLIDLSDVTGTLITSSTRIRSGSVEVIQSPLSGDNNANNRLDVGDATLVLRMLALLDPVRSWDITHNDLNLNARLDSGDAIKILRVASEIDPQPPVEGDGGSGGARLVVVPERLNVSAGEVIRVSVMLQGHDSPFSGAVFALNDSPVGLRLVGTSSHRLGSDVVAGALGVWNVSPAQNNYNLQDGQVILAVSSAEPWAANGTVLAEFTFEVQPGISSQYLWPLSLAGAELTTSGYDIVPLGSQTGAVRGRAPLPAQLEGIERLGSGEIQFAIRGDAGLNHLIEASSDLVHWEPLTTIQNSPASAVAHDPDASAHSVRFYRLRSSE